MKNTIFNVTHNSEGLELSQGIEAYRDLQNGYEYSEENLAIKAENFDKMIKDITKESACKLYDYSSSKNNIYQKYVNGDFLIYIRGNKIDYYMDIYAKSDFVLQNIYNEFKKYVQHEEGIELFFTTHFMNGNSLENNTETMTVKDFDFISDLYYPYIDTDLMFQQFFTGAENILMVVGAPGLGKSKLSSLLMKFAFENTNKLPHDKILDNPGLDEQYISVGYVKSTDVLANDNFWRELETTKYDFIIMDDLDYMLTKREAEISTNEDKTRNDFLNQFLSYTDGIKKNKTKFVITTNQSYKDIDIALLRKGRLFNILELRSLNYNEGLIIWKANNLKENDYEDIYKGTNHILSADLGSEISKRLNTRIDNAIDSYIKEQGISKLEDATRSKRVKL